jgi:hypothetical protein
MQTLSLNQKFDTGSGKRSLLPPIPPAIVSPIDARETASWLASPDKGPQRRVAQVVGESRRFEGVAIEDQLLVEYLSLVRQIAWRLHRRLPKHVELEELVSAGILGDQRQLVLLAGDNYFSLSEVS